MTSNLKTLVAALKASDVDMPTVMRKARSKWGISAKDADFAEACKSPKASVRWLLDEPNKEFLEEFLGLLAKHHFIGGAGGKTEAPARRSQQQAAKALRANGNGERVTKPERLAQLLSTKKGSTLAGIVREFPEWTEEAARWNVYKLRSHGYEVKNIGDRSNPTYQIQ